VLAGHAQFRFWESAEAALGLMAEFRDQLCLKGPRPRGRSVAGIPVPPVEDADVLAPFATGDARRELLASAADYASGDQDALEGPLEEYFLDRVAWLEASGRRLRTQKHPGAHAALGCHARRFVK
jgi:hypothetical protein